MKHCTNCGFKLKKGVEFCGNCGIKIPEKLPEKLEYCPECGFKIKGGSKFCGDCGFKVPEKIEAKNNDRKEQVISDDVEENNIPEVKTEKTFTQKYKYLIIGLILIIVIAMIVVASGILIPNKPPSASFSASPTSGTAPLDVSFTFSGKDTDGHIVSYSWNFGDGLTSNSINPSHKYSNPGTYTAELTVTDNDGETSTYSIDINVNEKPFASFSASPTSGTVPLLVTFTSSSYDSDGYIRFYHWDFGDGGTSSGALQSSFSRVFLTSGTFSVKLTVTDDDGAQDTEIRTITVLPLDSDGDGIADSQDIYDYGNGAIKVTIDEYHCDDSMDGLLDWSQPDTYFIIEVYSYKTQGGSPIYHPQTKSTVFYDDIDLYNPYYIIVDVKDDVQKIYVDIEAWDEDFDEDDHIDLSGETSLTYATGDYFYPLSYSSKSYSDDGRLDFVDEKDAWIEYTVEVVKYN